MLYLILYIHLVPHSNLLFSLFALKVFLEIKSYNFQADCSNYLFLFQDLLFEKHILYSVLRNQVLSMHPQVKKHRIQIRLNRLKT